MLNLPAPPSQRSRKFAFVFICQHGEIEVEAILLALSLKRFLRCDYELIAAIPTPAEVWGEPLAETLELLQSLDVKIQPIVNPLGRSFPFGNKMPCFNLQTDADKMFYLDSDILLIRDFYDEPRFDFPISAKPTDVKRDVDIRGNWPEIYQAVGLEPPIRRRPSTSSKYWGFPQFNGGVICLDTGIKLGDTWAHYIHLVRADDRFTPERVWSDQMGLALAIHKLGVEVDHFDERYNYPLHHKKLESGISPYFVHYHYPTLIHQEPILLQLVHDFVNQYPQVSKIIAGKPEWEALLVKKTVAPPPAQKPLPQTQHQRFPELLITGIPYSGAHELSQWLQNYSNCVVINHPTEIPTYLLSDSMIPWGVGMYYREARHKITLGKPVVSGQPDETSIAVDHQQFILGTTNPVGILSHLRRLHRVMPEVKVIVCIRHPLTTVAAWKKNQTVDSLLTSLGHLDDPWLTARHKTLLEAIISESNLPQKRAMLWHYFAELVLNEAPNVHLVHYEQLAVNPQAVIDTILQNYDKGQLRQRIVLPKFHQDVAVLNVEDQRAIRAICSQTATELGMSDLIM